MRNATLTAQAATLRRAVDADIEAIATLWHSGWCDGHLGHVPTTLLRHRRLGDLRQRVPARLDTTTVATIDSGVVGFVVTHVDEIEQLYVDAAARGTGVAAALLGHGETVINTRFERAWLAVVAGNTRARRFYERNGWSDTGAFDYPAFSAGDTTISVPAHRYEKRLTPLVVSSAKHAAALADDQTHQPEGGRGSSR
jgi:ribosomal protein S18 acetylase RimI-like enzyme